MPISKSWTQKAIVIDLRRRNFARPDGFTLVELLTVLVVVAILLSVAIGSAIALRARAFESRAESRLWLILPSIEAFQLDEGTYTGMTAAELRDRYDSTLDPTVYSFGTLTGTTYCVESSAEGKTWRKPGPQAGVSEGSCP